MPTSIKGVQNVDIPVDINNMYVVAFVADYIGTSSANLTKSTVYNAAIKKVVE